MFSPSRLKTSVLFVLGLYCLVSRVAVVPAADESSDTIVLTEDDLKALARGQTTTETAETEESARAKGKSLLRFEDCYSFPLYQFAYWEWLETGALSVVAGLEEQIIELDQKHRRVSTSQSWSEQLQDELDRIEGEIADLESEREQTLLEEIGVREAEEAESADERARIVLLRMALALNDLEAGNAKQAVEILDGAHEHLPNEPLVRSLRGIALREAGRGDEARNELLAALASQPTLLSALVTLAQMYEDGLDYDEAARFWDRARQAPLRFPRGVERWADRNRENFPQGEASLRSLFTERFQMRFRLARLRDFAHRYYQSIEKAGYKLIYDPSIGVPPTEEYVTPLREVVSRYIGGGDAQVEPEKIEQLFRALSLERDEQGFRRLMGYVSDTLATVRRDVGQQMGHRFRQPPVVVLYNPAVWEALIADPWTLGLFAPHGGSISLYLTPRMNPDELKNTIYHEYAHFATFDMAGSRDLPLWLVEGLAEHQALESGYDRFAKDPTIARWKELWASERVERQWFDKEQEMFDVADYYKARRVVGLLARRFGQDGLARFLKALGGGSDLDEASRAAFQMGYRDLLRYLVKQLPTAATD